MRPRSVTPGYAAVVTAAALRERFDGLLFFQGEMPEEMPEVLAAKDRSAAGPVAPAHGLCLVSVEYDEGWSGTLFFPPERPGNIGPSGEE